jgi:type I restriction enzyme S subunit
MGSVSIEGGLMVSKRTNDASDILRKGNLIMPKDDIGGGNIIGRSAYIDSDDKYALSDHLYALEPNEIEPLLLHHLINSEEVNVSMRSKAVGSAQLGISRKSVEDQEIRFPSSREEQKILAIMLGDIESTVNVMSEQLKAFSSIRNGIHKEVLTGNTRMPKS